MQDAIMIGGPFDGASATEGDPCVPSIWPCLGDDGRVWYRDRPVDGRPHYNRTANGRYVFEGQEHASGLRLEAVTA